MAEKSKKGGARPGAGRPTKAKEEHIRGLSLAAMTKVYGSEEAFFEFLWGASMDSFSHLQIAMHYHYGKPKERKEISGADGEPISFDPIKFIDES